MDLGLSPPARPCPEGQGQTSFSVGFQCVHILVGEQVTDKISKDLFKFFEREFFVH